MKTIGIVGSRRRNSLADFVLVKNAFLKVYEHGDRIVSGGCPRGADRFAEEIARDNAVPIIIHRPDWERLGKKAGFVRNVDIAKDADVLIACVAPDRLGGTEHTIREFMSRKAPEIMGPYHSSVMKDGRSLLVLV